MPNESGKVTAREREIGERARRFRESINWPQSAMAPEVDLSRDRLASVEYGRTPLRYPAGYRLCFIFDVNPGWLADGVGEMRAAAGALDLPTPDRQPKRALFSEIWDKVGGRKPRAPRPDSRGKAKKTADQEKDLIPHFDATGHVVSFMAELLAREKFRSPLERQEFALEITSYAHNLALRLRRATTQQLHVAAPHGRAAEAPMRNDKMTHKLREGAERLELELEKLHRAIEALSPAGGNPAFAPRPVASEASRLQEAMGKIAEQIQDAEARIRMLAPEKAES
jgi:transcriptional regulator with XRE-family HTH domain